MKKIELDTKFGNIRSDWDISPEQNRRLNDWLSQVEEPLTKKYFNGNFRAYERDGSYYVEDKLKCLAVAGVKNLGGKNFLDLGCGNSEGIDTSRGRIFEPWLCRSLLELGAKPIGIDIGNNSREEFENYQADLTRPNSLYRLEPKSVDVATALNFFDSPSIYQARINPDVIMNNLRTGLNKIIKPEGLFIYNKFLGGKE